MKRQSQLAHDAMVAAAVEHLLDKGFSDLRADIPGYSQPERILWTATGTGHIPDITAVGRELNLFEIETADSINDQHTADQWRLFATFAQQVDGVFWVVVPRGYSSVADARLGQLGLSARIWEL